MHDINLILTLTVGLTAALILGYVTHRLKLSPIVGYILAGVIIGSRTQGFMVDQNLAAQLAEVGVILLMFGVGLHFNLKDLVSVGKVAVPGALVRIGIVCAVVFLVGKYLNFELSSSILLGITLAISSTVVLTRVLVDNKSLHTPAGHIAIGWLIVEDIFIVLALIILPILFPKNPSLPITGENTLIFALGFALIKIVLFVAAMFVFGSRIIPWLFTKVSKSHSRELFTLTVLVTVLVIAVGSTKLFDVSMALGAFLAGMILGKSEFSYRAASEALPISNAFAVLFFVSVGMLLDPVLLSQNLPLLFFALFLVIIIKSLVAFLIILLLGYPYSLALTVSISLGQIGEFSFILGSLGKSLEIFSDEITNVIIATAIISITLNPLFFQLLPRIEHYLRRRPLLVKALSLCERKTITRNTSSGSHESDSKSTSKSDSIIVGYGPIGRTVRHLLKDNRLESTIIELNIDTTRKLHKKGVRAIYGDASHKGILEEAGIQSATNLILTSSNFTSPQEVIRLAKELNPNIRIIARTGYINEASKLKALGCDVVISGEKEVALALVEEVLVNLGATQEQVERERLRVREELVF